jgi:16S rRNA (adenine1518-N6/adenine1519-N6)-dimethyltransferase
VIKIGAQRESMNSHRARKRFGQHFLVDSSTIERIVRHINPQAEDNLVEIGPGKGAITSLLSSRCNHLHVIEIDRDLVAILQQQFANPDATTRKVTIHQADALTVDFSSFTATKPARVVGNLPYNISTPLIFHLLNFHDHIQDMYFMLQNEVVERLVAQPGDKHYGRLSIMVQYYCQADKLFEVPASCFNPRPKVNSAIVSLKPHKPLPYIADNPNHLSQLVNRTFQQRRKTLHNALKPFIAAKGSIPTANIDATPLPIDTRLRPENLSVSDYVMLSNFFIGH